MDDCHHKINPKKWKNKTKHWVGYWHPPISLPLNSPFSYTNSPPHQ